MANLYLRKDRSEQLRGTQQAVAMSFTQLSAEDLRKELGVADIPDGYVAGWASTPDLDLYRHVVKAGAFADSIRERGLMGPRAIKLLVGHDWDKVAGVIKKLEYRGERLWIEAQMNLNISYVRDAYEATKMLGGMNFSVGFMLQDYEFKEDDDKADYLQINRGDLFEVSIVPFPGNEAATMEFIKTRTDDAPTNLAEFEKALVAKGLARCRNDAQKITQVVKTCASLFVQKAPKQENSENGERPRLDGPDLTKALAYVSEIKKILALEAAK